MSRTPLLLLSLFCASLCAESRPNIVFILADDLGYGEVGYNGQKIIRTPNVDRLAREGIGPIGLTASETIDAARGVGHALQAHPYFRGVSAEKPSMVGSTKLSS